MNKIRILYVEDNEYDFMILKEYLEEDYDIDWVDNYNDAIIKIQEKKHDIYLIDYYLGLKTGIDVLREINKAKSDKPTIMITGQLKDETDIESLNEGATDYITKDQIQTKVLSRSIKYSIERKKLERKLKQEKELQKLIFDTTTTGLCLVDLSTNKIIQINQSLFAMFSLKEEDVQNHTFSEIFTIMKYRDSIYSNELEGEHICPAENCPCIIYPFDFNVKSISGVTKDCLMSCRSMEIVNGVTKKFRVISLVDITKQKFIETKLIDTTKQLTENIRNYSIQTNNKEALLSLVNIGIDKICKNEEVGEKW